MNLQVATDVVVEFNGDISRMLHYPVWHVRVPDRLRVVALTANAEIHSRSNKHLNGIERVQQCID